ncbi:MAG: LamB/YcsF family protein [Deltaproteobacteria bacterium]
MKLELDAGEGESEELWPLFDALAIACGGHTGDAASMRRVIETCAACSIEVGAHPSYVDREGFGRRSLAVAPMELEQQIYEQCAALAAIAAECGVNVTFVKPHGALYHDAARDPALAAAVIAGAVRALGNVAVLGPSWGTCELQSVATARGLAYWREGFADRALRPDGALVPRGEPGALIEDPAAAAAQASALATKVDALCIHGDSPNALAIARAVRAVV